MKKKQLVINLLRHQEKSPLDKFLDWAFTVGRVIVVITESIALSAFAYRFVLDRQIIDLRDKIKSKQTIVTLSKTNEEKFRSLQTRLAVARDLGEKEPQESAILADILEIAKGKASFTAVDITDAAISLQGAVPSISSLSIFANDLRKLPVILTVSIDNIRTETATGIILFSINTTIKAPVEK